MRGLGRSWAALAALVLGVCGSIEARELTLEQRIEAQRAIEQVYWVHRAWPESNPGPKPPLAEVLPEAALRERVEQSLRMSALLDSYWRRPIDGPQLQAEIDRMTRATKAPEVLQEIRAALGDDPFLIAECLARPALAQKLAAAAFASDDRIHGPQRLALEAMVARAAGARAAGSTAEVRIEGVKGRAVEARLAEAEGRAEGERPAGPAGRAAFDALPGEHTRVRIALDEQRASRDPFDEEGHLRGASGIETLYVDRAGWDAELASLALRYSAGRGPHEDTALALTAALDAALGPAPTAGVEAGLGPARIGAGSAAVVPPDTNGSRAEAAEAASATLRQVDDRFVEYEASRVPLGVVSPLLDRGDRFTAVLVERGGDDESLIVSTVSWTKRDLRSWAIETAAAAGFNAEDAQPVVPPPAGYTATAPQTTGCTDDTWTRTGFSGFGRRFHTVVWTGSEMIIWGGALDDDGQNLLNSGERYNPATDAWTPTSITGAVPTIRMSHTAVWSGTEMIIWGGRAGNPPSLTRTGGRYNPASDSWIATSTSGSVPAERYYHSAVWAGTRMIVWGGFIIDGLNFLNSGGRYNPSTDSWQSTSTGQNVPIARADAAAVWTGSEMIIWGGDHWTGSDIVALNSGGRYNPNTNAWSTMSTGANTPAPRYQHSMIWTGSRVIVWGGQPCFVSDTCGVAPLNTGGIYNPSADAWLASSLSGGVGANTPSSRTEHTAVWTGSEMIVWGGWNGSPTYLNSGGRYDPAADAWAPTSTSGLVPAPRYGATAVWTGSADRRMIVWGGEPQTTFGGLYCASECTAGAAGCSDANLCTTDACVARACVSTPVACTAVDSCHDAGVCNPSTGNCSTGGTKPDGVSCTDGNACTAACPTCGLDTCIGGVCGCPNTPGPCTGTVSYAVRTVASTDVPKAISSSGTPLVTSTVSVSIAGRPTIYDLDVRTFLRHTNASNIDMTLQSPAGTVVTLTTDNGGTNDNVFDGTVWDDDANPGGQIPYSTNNGLATDHNYLNGVTASPLAPEEALGAFNGEDPNGTWTLTISDDLTLDGGVLDDWSITMATIDVAAPSLATAGYTATGLPISIDDFTPLGRPTTKTIAVSGAGSSIWKVTATTGITHTNNADLDVTLRSPQGTIVTLTTDNGGSFDNTFANVLWDDDASPGGQVPYTFTGGLVTDNNYANQPTTLVPEEGLAAFRGENPNGTWTLTIWDDTAGNTGNLNSFALNITTAACPESCVVDCNDQDGCTSDSCNPSLGCVHGCTGGASCIPGPIANIGMAPDKSTIVWDHATGGASSAHDLVRGQCGQFPVGTGAAETCLASALAATTAPDSARPPVGAAFWYDVRGHHVCGDGPYGLQTGGAPRTTGACP